MPPLIAEKKQLKSSFPRLPCTRFQMCFRIYQTYAFIEKCGSELEGSGVQSIHFQIEITVEAMWPRKNHWPQWEWQFSWLWQSEYHGHIFVFQYFSAEIITGFSITIMAECNPRSKELCPKPALPALPTISQTIEQACSKSPSIWTI